VVRLIVLCRNDYSMNVEPEARCGMGNTHWPTRHIIADALVIPGFSLMMMKKIGGSVAPVTIFVCEYEMGRYQRSFEMIGVV